MYRIIGKYSIFKYYLIILKLNILFNTYGHLVQSEVDPTVSCRYTAQTDCVSFVYLKKSMII